MLSITPFQFFLSSCCVFIKFDTKLYRATLLEISFLHFRNTSLLHTLTQLAVKSDVLMLSSWNFHWSPSKNVCLGWCLSCGSLPVVEPRIQCHYIPDAPLISEWNGMWESGSIKLAQDSYHWQVLIEHGKERRFSAAWMLHLGWRVRIVTLRIERVLYGAWCVSQ